LANPCNQKRPSWQPATRETDCHAETRSDRFGKLYPLVSLCKLVQFPRILSLNFGSSKNTNIGENNSSCCQQHNGEEKRAESAVEMFIRNSQRQHPNEPQKIQTWQTPNQNQNFPYIFACHLAGVIKRIENRLITVVR